MFSQAKAKLRERKNVCGLKEWIAILGYTKPGESLILLSKGLIYNVLVLVAEYFKSKDGIVQSLLKCYFG